MKNHKTAFHVGLLWLFAAAILVSSCNSSGFNLPIETVASAPSATPLPSPNATPQSTSTPTPSPTPLPATATITPTISPTPTISAADKDKLRRAARLILDTYLEHWRSGEYIEMFRHLANADAYGIGDGIALRELHREIDTEFSSYKIPRCNLISATIVICDVEAKVSTKDTGTISNTVKMSLEIIDNQWKVNYWGVWKVVPSKSSPRLVRIDANGVVGDYTFELTKILVWTDAIVLVTRESWKADRRKTRYWSLPWKFERVEAIDDRNTLYDLVPDISACCSNPSSPLTLQNGKSRIGWLVLRDLTSTSSRPNPTKLSISVQHSLDSSPFSIPISLGS